MASITTTDGWRSRLTQFCWFLVLWAAGVGAAILLALPFKLLIRLGTGIH